MAAGEGRRLRPLTERWPKPVLPIDGRPVVATVVRELAAAGVGRVTVVTGHLAEQIEALLGDAEAYGVEIRFVRQPRAEGSADAVRRALAGGADPPALIATADTVFAPGDVRRFREAVEQRGAPGALAVRRDPPPGPGRAGVRVADGRVLAVPVKTGTTPLAAASLWHLGTALVAFFDDLAGPPYELAEVFQRAIDSGLEIGAVEIGRTRDLTYPVDLVQENFPYLAGT